MKEQLILPLAVSNYFTATNDSDLQKFLTTFSRDAIVSDEGKTYRGIKEIEKWRSKTIAAFKFLLELTSVRFTPDEIIVSSNCTGNFPGSPVLLYHHFQLEDKLISALSIRG